MGMADVRPWTPVARALAQRDDAVDALREFQWHTCIEGFRCHFCNATVADLSNQIHHKCPNFPGLRTPRR